MKMILYFFLVDAAFFYLYFILDHSILCDDIIIIDVIFSDI